MTNYKGEIYQALKKYWGFDSFRSLQEDIVLSTLDGNNTLALLPTGGGKSLCYQLPALVLEGKTLVISPLIALMEDQVLGLKRRGVKSKALHSGMSAREIDITIDNWIYGDVKLLFVAPERLRTPIFHERLKKVKLSLVAIDEAHCISQWGYDFRPAYFDIVSIKQLFPKVPFIALTATATPDVIEDIIDKLGIQKSRFYKKSFLRDNLSISVLLKENKDATLLEVLGKMNGTGIIYQRNRAQTQYIASLLAASGLSVTYYHGGLSYKERQQRQEQWMKGQVQIMVCTNAFGMGIDKSDVRFVIHLDIPPSIEEYYQEIGRAGRDGQKAHVISILNKSDFSKAIYNHQSSFAQLEDIAAIYHKLYSFLKIPVGSGNGESFNFDVSEFISRTNLPVRLVWNTIGLFEKEGFMSLSENSVIASKVLLLVTGPQVNEMLRDQHDKLEIVHHMLRIYEGLFLEPTAINEEAIAKKMNVPIHEVVQKLKRLHSEGIIQYKKGGEQPQISFHQERWTKANFKIDEKKYHLRKERALFRLTKMIEFFQTKDCRQSTVLQYFGEKSLPCGICDNCLSALSVNYSSKDYNDLHTHLFKYLGKQKIVLEDYVLLWPYNRRAKIKSIIKVLEKERALSIVNDCLVLPEN